MWIFENPRIQATLLKISILWPNKYSVPWVPASMQIVRKMLALADVGSEDRVYDLGCGDGRIVITAARDYGVYAVGIERDFIRYLWCQILIAVLGLRDRVSIVYGDFFEQDISKATVITCYLQQSTNEELQRKFKRELQPNARIVSYNFTFPKFDLAAEDAAGLYLYHLTTEIQGAIAKI